MILFRGDGFCCNEEASDGCRRCVYRYECYPENPKQTPRTIHFLYTEIYSDSISYGRISMIKTAFLLLCETL